MSNIISSSLHASERGLDPLTGDALPLYWPVRIYLRQAHICGWTLPAVMRGVEPHVSREHGASNLLAHVTFMQYVVLLVRHPIMEFLLFLFVSHIGSIFQAGTWY